MILSNWLTLIFVFFFYYKDTLVNRFKLLICSFVSNMKSRLDSHLNRQDRPIYRGCFLNNLNLLCES